MPFCWALMLGAAHVECGSLLPLFSAGARSGYPPGSVPILLRHGLGRASWSDLL